MPQLVVAAAGPLEVHRWRTLCERSNRSVKSPGDGRALRIETVINSSANPTDVAVSEYKPAWNPKLFGG